MNIKVKEIETALRQERSPLAAVRELQEAIQFTDTDIRQHIFNLQRLRQEPVNLITAVKERVEKFQIQSGIEVCLEILGDWEGKLSATQKNHLLGILQEILCNIQKHAQAEQVRIILKETGGSYHLVIKDNGLGFETAELKTSKSFGLRILEERSRAIGAKFSLQSSPGEGTVASVCLEPN